MLETNLSFGYSVQSQVAIPDGGGDEEGDFLATLEIYIARNFMCHRSMDDCVSIYERTGEVSC